MPAVVSYLPGIVLGFLKKKRQEAIFLGLPDALDLMVVCVEAGLTVDAAMHRVGQELMIAHPSISRELAITYMETRVGLSRQEALKNLGVRTGNPALQSEKAETWTAGLVLRSPSAHPFWSGFRGSVDWYRIRITDMIAQEGGDAVFQRCLDPALNPTGDAFGPECSVIGRDPLTGLVSYTIQGGS